MTIRLSQNRKILAGSSISLIACLFMLAVYGTHDHVPLPIVVVYLLALVVGSSLLTWVVSRKRIKGNIAC
jgi:hypothetical protein